MSHKLYRVCLLSLLIIAIVGGIFYYLNYVQDQSDITEGTLVRQTEEILAGGSGNEGLS
ncbi:MAG: hypothetical protein HFI76_10140 [Lachnospiraceae bacterium]|jgi:hypothetical protein|nr:hypothetical protein [Lachnospiraceae bacterium]